MGGSPASDFRLLLTVIASISRGVAAAAMPSIIAGPFANWTYAARLVMWLAGVLAVILEYLAVSYGVRLYLQRADFADTTSLAFVFLALAEMLPWSEWTTGCSARAGSSCSPCSMPHRPRASFVT